MQKYYMRHSSDDREEGGHGLMIAITIMGVGIPILWILHELFKMM